MTIDTIRLKKLAEAATPGPWCWDKGEDPRPHTYGIATDADPECMVVNQDFGIELKEDAYFIAAASPATILALLEEISRIETESAYVMAGFRSRAEIIDQLKADNEVLRSAAMAAREFIMHEAEVHGLLDDKGQISHRHPRRQQAIARIEAALAKESSHD